MKNLKKILKRKMKILKKAYRSTDKKTEGHIWLNDNFHIIEKYYSAAIRTAKSTDKNIDLSNAADICKELCSNGILPDTKETVAFLLKKNLSTAELMNLPFCIIVTLISYAANSITTDDIMQNTIKSFIRFPDIHFGKILYEVSETEKILCQDPAGVYRNMSEQTKEQYRNAIFQESEKTSKSETEVAVEVLEKAVSENKHIGFYLNLKKSKHKQGIAILITESVLPLIVGSILSLILREWYILPLLYLPLFEALKFITDTIFSFTTASEPLPRMDFSSSIPEDEKTVIAVSMMLPSAVKAKETAENLKQLCLSNCRDNTCICILADLKSFDVPVCQSDATDIKAMKRVVNSLNQESDNKFILAIRPRRYSKTENEYTGLERKRGAITSLIKLIAEGKNDFQTLYGAKENLAGAKYIMALDSDTKMPMGSLKELVGIAAHPLNRPVVSLTEQRVTSGYGIISPRIETDIKSANKTHFSSIMAGNGGLPAYTSAVRERYMEFFGESIFSGKGLIDIKTFNTLLPERFPEQYILSHDILEGIILRTAFAGEIALTDSFPSNATAYFKRLHRWIRGDIQNLRFVFKRKKSLPSGTIPFEGKRRLLDNIRRAVTPIFALAAIILSVFMPENAATVTAVSALLSVSMPYLFSGVRTLAAGGISMLSRLYFSDAAPFAMICFARALFTTVMMVRSAVCSIDAATRSLFRMLISKKHLLEWTTAADSDSTSLKTNIKKSAPSVIVGVFLLFSPFPITKFAGITFLLDLPLSIFSEKEKKFRTSNLSDKEKNRLLSYCASMWRFYEEYCTENDNWLIPDNVQLTPVFRVAHRTSPTNIGLMLCAFLAARDFNFIDSNELYNMLSKSFGTIELLKKHNGNLYNWYNTKTLEIMEPSFVSTVDSGNFLCCLVALKEGLKSYLNENSNLETIIEKCEKMINSCDLDFLYNKQRNLFSIGFECSNGKFSESYFDLLMSEARMTSYFAVASGKVPLKHWESLSRTLSKNGRYTGPVSWSGTMFEYFMPAIFLPSERNTLASEALRYCIHCQKKRVKNMHIPYGISESGYFAFDNQLNYQYKAHGVKELSQRAVPFNELVISPYSSFLTIPEDPHDSMHNLAQLEKLGMYGKYGFYEACDFEKKRNDGQDYSVIRSFMAHHVGMSFLAAANGIFSGIMQKRFMRDFSMAGGKNLLNERILSDTKVYKKQQAEQIAERPERIQKTKTQINSINISAPLTHVLTNGEWSYIASDNGASISVYGNTCIFKKQYPSGVFAAIKTQNGEIIPFTCAPFFNRTENYSVLFSETDIRYKNNTNAFVLTEKITVHPRLPSQIHTFSIKNKTKEKKQLSIMIYCEPNLENINERTSHPAFSKLFVDDFFEENENICTFTRKKESKNEQMYISAGFYNKDKFVFSTDRESVLPRKNGILGLFSQDFSKNSSSVDKCLAMQLTLTVPPKATVSKSLIICGAPTKEDCINTLIQIRNKSLPSFDKCARSPFSNGSITEIYAKKLIERHFFNSIFAKEIITAQNNNTLSLKDLWKHGISGDYPIILAVIDDEDFTPIKPFIKLRKKMKLMGIATELVFISNAVESYTDKLTDLIKSECKENADEVLNKHGGIFTLNNLSESEFTLLVAAAIAVYPEKSYENKNTINQTFTEFLPSTKPDSIKNAFTNNGYIIGKEPYLPWCHIIANRNFGTLVSDSSPGFTWAKNASLNKLTPWSNDTREIFSGEMLILSDSNKRYDIIKGSAAYYKRDSACYLASAADFSIKTEITVPGENSCKELSLNIKNNSDEEKDINVYYFVEPLLGSSAENSKFIKIREADGKAFAYTPFSDYFNGCMCIFSDDNCTFTYDKSAFFAECTPDELIKNCIIANRTIKLPPKNETKLKFYLTYAATPQASIKNAYITPKKINTSFIKIETPDNNLNYLFNNFLQNQIIEGRIFGRTGFYQCSGAFGFRDQLQDSMSVVLTHPEILKIQILKCAAAQFTQGDVLHWFHELAKDNRRILLGVRTICSDDLLWLPLAVSEYCTKTGDYSILYTKIPYIESPVLEKGEKERYGEYYRSDKTGTVYEHCIRAFNHACTFGKNGLPLMKGGDWNDSYNAVGTLGKGESVWLGMFLIYVAKKFSEVSQILKDRKTAERLQKIADRLTINIDENAWDNDRYLRCFYDDGSPMGKKGNESCEIDLLPQAWSIIADMPDKNRSKKALNTAYELLFDKKASVVKLFTPGFNQESKPTGYVNRYPEGVRENGGQYTHGAVWFADAFFRIGDGNKGYEILKAISPAEKDSSIYKIEPYYLAGDVYSKIGMEGRGGWSIYTGSAGWYYRTVYEKMLGINQINGNIKINPCLPDGFGKCKVTISNHDGTRELIINQE